MKYLLIPFWVGLVLPAGLRAQKAPTNSCQYQWRPWETAYAGSKGTIRYALQTSRCASGGVCGTPIVALEHTFRRPTFFTIRLEGVLCDGKVEEHEFSTAGNYIAPGRERRDPGNWHFFTRVTRVVRVQASYYEGKDRYELTVDGARNLNQLLVNGKPEAQFKAERAQVETAAKRVLPSASNTSGVGSTTGRNAPDMLARASSGSPGGRPAAYAPAKSNYSQERQAQPAEQRPSAEALRQGTMMDQVQQTRNEVEQRFASNKSGEDVATGVAKLVDVLTTKSPMQQQMENEAAARRASRNAEFLLKQKETLQMYELAKAAHVQSLADRAGKGESLAMLQLGCYYQCETNNESEGVQWFQLAADNGNAPAMFRLALHYARKSTTDWEPLSVQWLEKGAAANDQNSLERLGQLYYSKATDTVCIRKSIYYLTALDRLGYKAQDENNAFVWEYEGKKLTNCIMSTHDMQDISTQDMLAISYQRLAKLGPTALKKGNLESGIEWFERLSASCEKHLAEPNLSSSNKKRVSDFQSYAKTSIKKIQRELQKI